MGLTDSISSIFAVGVVPPASAFAACGVAPATDWTECGSDIAPATPPVLDSITPTTGVQEDVGIAMTLYGSNFALGATVVVSGTLVTVSNVVVVSSTVITCTFDIALLAAHDVRDVTVVNP